MLLEPSDDARSGTFTEALSGGAPVQISTSRAMAFHDLAVALDRVDDVGPVEVLTDDDTVTNLRDYFFAGAKLCEYIQQEILEIRTQSTPVPTLVLVDSMATAISGLPGAGQITLDTTKDEFIAETNRTFSAWFEEAATVTLRKPAYGELVSELEARFDTDVRADLETALLAAREPNRPLLSVDPASISIVIGALHELEFHELARWGEDTQLASKATFWRTKNELEKLNVIAVTSVQRDVGRPRHQLLPGEDLADDSSVEAIIDDVARRVYE